MTTDTLPVRIDIPPDAHPGVIRGDTQGSQLARAVLTDLYSTTAKINDTAKQVEDRARLAAAAAPIAEKVTRRAGEALATLAARQEAIQGQIEKAITPRGCPTTAAQIRSHFAGQGAAASQEAMKAVRSGCQATAAAILSAPAYLSGLNENSYSLLRKAASEQFAPELVNELIETRAAHTKVDRAANSFVDQIGPRLRSWADTTDQAIKKGLQS